MPTFEDTLATVKNLQDLSKLIPSLNLLTKSVEL